MTQQVTFHGAPSLELGEGRTLFGRLDDAARLTLVCKDAWGEWGETLWESAALDLGPDPRREFGDSHSMDFLALSWPANNAVVVLGAGLAVVVSSRTGEERARFALQYVGKASLEVSWLHLVSDRGPLLIASAKTVWVVGPDLRSASKVEPRFLLKEDPAVQGTELVLTEYDFDGKESSESSEFVQERIELAELKG